MLPFGTTVVGSQGDAGAANIADYIAHTINQSTVHVKLAINASRVGESTVEGCFEDIDNIDVSECVEAIDRYRSHIWGVAVNVSHHACGATDPKLVMTRGLEIAKAADLPLLFGMRRPEDWSLAEQLRLLRAGDVVTYCFRRSPHCIVNQAAVLPAVWDARKRGVLFDIGHGTASYDPEVARIAINDEFAPDTISTDLQARHIGQTPRHTLPLVMEKLLTAGMPKEDILTAVTSTPSRIMQVSPAIEPGAAP
ncbi:MAG: hypothetical protein CMJ78_13190 [Planctomycetaceae bacterium]|nr:hypothetical protein [Planctomycetaceae bacterium]